MRIEWRKGKSYRYQFAVKELMVAVKKMICVPYKKIYFLFFHSYFLRPFIHFLPVLFFIKMQEQLLCIFI